MRIFLMMPRYNQQCYFEAARAYFNSVAHDSAHEIQAASPAGSVLTNTFNGGWAYARSQWRRRQLDAFAMIHSDMGAQPGWLDILLAEMEASGTDLMSAVVPIKDGRRLASVAVDNPRDPWAFRRLTMREVGRMPATFTSADVGGPLLVNTGLWVCKLGDWCLQTHFQFLDCIREEGGEDRARLVPEDWDFSRQLMRIGGVKIGATSKAQLGHWGEYRWSNQDAGGWDTDEAFAAHERKHLPGLNGSAAKLPDDWRFPVEVAGWLSEEEGRALGSLATGKDVLEIGSYCGRSTVCLAQTANSVDAVDTFDGRGTPAPADTLGLFQSALAEWGVQNRVTAHRGQSRQVVPTLGQFDLAFVDGAHDLRSVLGDARLALGRLRPGGLLCFHDYRNVTDPEVTEAVETLLATGAELLAVHGTLAVLRPVSVKEMVQV